MLVMLKAFALMIYIVASVEFAEYKFGGQGGVAMSMLNVLVLIIVFYRCMK